MNVLDYFQGVLGAKPSTNGWYSFTCPVCGKYKGAVHPDRGDVKCWRGCYHTRIYRFLWEIMGLPLEEAKEIDSSNSYEYIREERPFKGVCFPEGYLPLTMDGPLREAACAYLSARGLDPARLGSRGWGYCSEGDFMGRIIIPYYLGGILRYYTGRTFVGDSLRYRNLPTEQSGSGKSEFFYNEDAMLRGPFAIMEGAIDAETIGAQAVASGGWELSPTQLHKLIQSPHGVWFIPDAGRTPSGETFLSKTIPLMQQVLLQGRTVMVSDLNRLPGKDVNELGREVVASVAEPVTLDTIAQLQYRYLYG